ncbi:MAG: hypothetical protein M5U09_22750 [Gammaproteobacteria bacterium]|nr:hypothetical protein [Gammaproteobacteria bacterium]
MPTAAGCLVAVGARVEGRPAHRHLGHDRRCRRQSLSLATGRHTGVPRNLTNNVDPLKYLIPEEQMELYRWALLRVAGGHYRDLLAAYDKLRAAGYWAELEASEVSPGRSTARTTRTT